MSFSVAVDGPAGAGKSTIARQVAKRMNFIYVDTGAMYRAMALFFLRNQIGASDEATISQRCQEAEVTIRHENGEQVVYLNGENVNTYLRTEEVGNMASASSKNPKVREKMKELQVKLAQERDVIMDGRDIGTCVLPGADVKVYLTASVDVRAKRRYEELTAKGETCQLEKIKEDIASRDYQDMHRDIAPLRQAEDAILVDSSNMTIEEVVEKIISLCKEKRTWK